MITKAERGGGGFLVGLGLLGVGIAIGLLVDPERWLVSGEGPVEAPRREVTLHRNLQPAETPDEPRANGLETLHLEVEPLSAETLQRVRDRAMDRGMIIQTDDDTVPAVVRLGDQRLRADIRIKGDWTDHVSTDKWSLRVSLKDGKLLGMRVFSVQAPFTRGYLWEWLVLAAARREGVLAPRATFVNVTVNGHDAGVYYLEEHFSKELLESQGRREGPIVLWDESARWSSLLQAHNVPTKGVELPVPRSAIDVWGVAPAFVRAYGEKHLGSSDSLNASFFNAVEQMRALERLVLSAETGRERLRRLQELEDLQGETVDTLVETDRLACAHALASLFQIEHSLIWHNMRFYHDPVLDRLEPIMFDNMAHQASARDPVMFRAQPMMAQFGSSTSYYNGVFRHLGRMCRPAYLDELFAALGPDLARFEAALEQDGGLGDRNTALGMLQRLRTEQAYLRGVIYPVDPVSFAASYELDESEPTLVTGLLEVRAWSTTRTPVVIEGFRFSNGSFSPALPKLVPGEHGTSPTPEGGVVLPANGRRAVFRFPMNERLANLENVDQVIQAARERTGQGGKLDLDVDVVFRPVAAEETESEKLEFRRREPAWDAERGRPPAPTLAEALARHPFLELEAESGRLRVHSGRWEVAGDLIVPSGYTLYATGAVRLQFQEDAVLLTDAPLVFEGGPGTGITLEPAPGVATWKGIVVLAAPGRSEWTHVTVRDTDAVERAGWVVTGGINFYHSPVTMRDCTIEGTVAEDGTNIFGTDFLMERVTFAGCVSDSFDGDFVKGTVRDCVFRDGLADGVDFSGSDVDVVGCRFLDMGDKAVSAGEDSVVRIDGGLVDGVSIGIASKDRSRVEARDLVIRNARNYALAAFVKKPEFGPSELTANGVVIEGSGLGEWIVQTGCRLTVDGEELPTQDLDVARLYAEKILGQ